MPFCILMRERKRKCGFGWVRSGEDLGGVGVRGIMIRIYCIKIYLKKMKNERKSGI